MRQYKTKGYKVFEVCNYIVLILLAIVCIFPVIHILALSFSSSTAAAAGRVSMWPVDFNLMNYTYVLSKGEFVGAFMNSVYRVLLGTTVNMLLIIMLAYPLSKDNKDFRLRTVYVWIFLFTTLFGGGLIPTYLTVKQTGLIDTIWALVLPGAVPVFNVILLLNFFRGIPKELEEAAFMDGAGHFTILFKVFLPISVPALATVGLFTIVGHWNAWFDGLIYMNKISNYPLSSFMQTLVISKTANITAAEALLMAKVSERTGKCAQIFLGMLPILVIYPFLQKYFTTGIVLGSVKG